MIIQLNREIDWDLNTILYFESEYISLNHIILYHHIWRKWLTKKANRRVFWGHILWFFCLVWLSYGPYYLYDHRQIWQLPIYAATSSSNLVLYWAARGLLDSAALLAVNLNDRNANDKFSYPKKGPEKENPLCQKWGELLLLPLLNRSQSVFWSPNFIMIEKALIRKWSDIIML